MSERDEEGNPPQKNAREKALHSFLSTALRDRRSRYRITHLRAPQPRPRTGVVLLILILTGFLLVFSGSNLLPVLLASSGCSGAGAQNAGSTGNRAVALIDQLSLQYPNPGFVQNVSQTARTAGYGFDYYPPATATVGFFQSLPAHNYSIVILRTHGTGIIASDPPSIVTSDQYSQSQHTIDQLTNKLSSVEVNGTRYFGLESSFITDVMCGRFPATIILVMTCQGAQFSLLARAFLEKGAAGYIGWNGVVSVSHTDIAFQSLVKLLLEDKTVNQSVQDVMSTLGPDPLYGSRLVGYTQASFPAPATAPWWQEYWYLISASVVMAIIGLGRVRNRPNKTVAKAPDRRTAENQES